MNACARAPAQCQSAASAPIACVLELDKFHLMKVLMPLVDTQRSVYSIEERLSSVRGLVQKLNQMENISTHLGNSGTELERHVVRWATLARP